MIIDKIKKGKSSSKVVTGLSSFDKITGGGLPRPSALALIGTADGGKEVLIRQIVWHLLQKGSKVLYYSLSQSDEELRDEMLQYGWDVKPFEENGMFRIVDVFSDAIERMSKEFTEDFNPEGEVSELSFHKMVYDLKLIYDEGMKFMPAISGRSINRFVIFDSISPLFQTNADGVFQMIHTLKFASRLTKVTGICIMHTGMHGKKIEATFKSLADGIIEVNRIKTSNYISIPKYPGEHEQGPFPIEISNGEAKILPISMPELNLR
jgi:KaiC/GvpD/RAD55 family RecA-like ATPase